VAFIDAAGQIQNVLVTVLALPSTSLFTSAPATVTMALGEASRSFTVGGGRGGYVFSSSSVGVVTVPGAPSTTLVLTPVGRGSATVTVTDEAGSARSFTVTVGETLPLTLSVGSGVTLSSTSGPLTYAISGGRSPYTAVSQNTSVVTAATSGSTLTLTPAASGGTTVVVTDVAGTQITLTVNVASAGVSDMSVSPGSAVANVGDRLFFRILGGTAPYNIDVNNPSVATLVSASPTSNSLVEISALNAGATNVTITDSGGQVERVALTINQAATALRVSPTTLLLPETYSLGIQGAPSNINLTVYGGTGPFVAYTTDPRRSAVSVIGSSIKVFRGTVGTLCSDTDVTKYSLAAVSVTDPLQPASTAFDLVVTVVDALGASATAKLVIVDDNQNLDTAGDCR
jgi:hypothetical protein